MTSFIPVNEPLLDGNERKYLNDCIDSGWISAEGPYVRRFEAGLADRVHRRHGIAVTNGTDALDLAIWALNLEPGDEVILPAFTIISCANALVRHGLVPVVVDCDPSTWNMDTDVVRTRISAKTKAIMVVHIYGLPVDMDPILALIEEFGLQLVEDCAEAIGQTYRGRPCGSFGDISIFSFYANKHITTGEGGMVVTDDDNLAERCRWYRNLCFENPRFRHLEMGRNMRMSNIQAAVGVAQLERLDAFIERKRMIGDRYQERLSAIGNLQLPVSRTDYADNHYWVFALVLGDRIAFDAACAIERFAAKGIGTRPFFWPINQQPVFKRMGLFSDDYCPVAERISVRGLYLPSGLALDDSGIDQVCNVCFEVFEP